MTGDGTVIVSLAAGVAHDAAGNACVASTSTDNTVTYDGTAPTANVTTAPPTITTAGDGSTTLTVTYADSGSGINTATFATTNLAVTNGATVSAYSASGDAVTYTITAPSGTWGGSPQGTYTVSLVANQVQDLAGNAAAANASLATFVVNAISDVPPQVMGVYLSGSTWSRTTSIRCWLPVWGVPRSASSWPPAADSWPTPTFAARSTPIR